MVCIYDKIAEKRRKYILSTLTENNESIIMKTIFDKEQIPNLSLVLFFIILNIIL
jgi:hypothetical protein